MSPSPYRPFPWVPTDNHRLRHRGVGLGGDMVQRDKRIGLRIVGRGVTHRGGIGHDEEIVGSSYLHAPVAIGVLGDQIHPLALRQSHDGDVVGIDENDPSAPPYATVAVVETIDRGVVLVMTAQSL